MAKLQNEILYSNIYLGINMDKSQICKAKRKANFRTLLK